MIMHENVAAGIHFCRQYNTHFQSQLSIDVCIKKHDSIDFHLVQMTAIGFTQVETVCVCVFQIYDYIHHICMI